MFDVLKKLDWFFLKYWKRYTVAIIALIIASLIGLIPPMLIGQTIDEINYNSLTSERLWQVIGLFAVLIVLHYVISYVWDYTLFSGSAILERLMRSKLMGHFFRMTPTFFDKKKVGDLMAQGTNDLRAIYMTSGFGVLTLVDSSIFMLMIIGIMGFSISWELTLVALIPMPIMAIVMHKYGEAINERFTEAQEAFGNLNNDVLESIRGIRVTRAFVQEKQDEQRFQAMTEDVYQKNIKVAKIDALFEPTMKILVGLSYTIGIGYGALLVFRNEITLGNLVSFNMYLGMLIWPMFAVGELINVLQRGNASLDRVNTTLDYPADVTDPGRPADKEKPGDIIFDSVSFRYPGNDTERLHNITLEIKQGTTLGVVGKTGAGKSTLFKQLLRQYPPGEGRLLLGGIPIEQFTLEKTRSWIGYVPQEQILFSKSIRENIQYGKHDATDEEIFRVMELAHFLTDIQSLPEGLDTKVGESGVTLSGGQKQRVALARAFVKNPEVLILDDSMSAVDGKTEANIIEHLKTERQDKTTIIAAHRLSAVKHAEQIIVLDAGGIKEQGTHEELLAANGWYASQYYLQQLEDKEVISS
ncbi:multidrug ABC transporter permease/ATP-binding protein [Terribacillus saccharophilus]|uniref:Multidrug ABC transporter permease/ATP-binding protein n=1 Tax=Terribacillus saccharophilus TaxID=361277 RepID=A0A268HA94_9BACI|nr:MULTISPECIES: ABC transporter ATP-binding protein [Terribacillus]PAE06750.1 multidrug ABC transporter permease/ATP-binding protein [Terribacillus saccharophilus]